MSLRFLFFTNIHKLFLNFQKSTNDRPLSKRLTQKIISIFKLHKIEFINTKKNFIKLKKLNFKKSGLNLNLVSKKIDISLLAAFKLYSKFICIYFIYLISIINSLFALKKKYSSYNFIYFGKKRLRINDFKEVIIKIKKNFKLQNNSLYIIDYNYNLNYSNNIYFSKRPVVQFFKICLNNKKKIQFFLKFIKLFFIFNFRIIQNKSLLLVGQDLIENEIYNYTNKNYKINIYCNISKLTDTPYWFKKENYNIKTYFIWDSIEPFLSLIFNKKDLKIQSMWIPYLCVDQHCFEEEIFKKFYKRISLFIPKKKIRLLKSEKIKYIKTLKNNNKAKLIIFDVNPEPGIYFDNLKNYEIYANINNIKKFILDIVNIVNKINLKHSKNIEVVLKRKKMTINSELKKEYYNFLKEKKIKIINNFNHKKINFSLAIIYPMTSIPHIYPEIIKKLFLYYDPTSEIYIDKKFTGVDFSKSKKNLENRILKIAK